MKEFNGIRLIIEYTMKKGSEEEIIFMGESEHCFLDDSSRPINIKSKYPEFYMELTKQI